MRIFIGGATGAIGRPLVRHLVAAGHEVTGTTRSPDRAALLRESGAEPVVVDALDREGVVAAVAAARPDVVVHELTQIPSDFNPRKFAQVFAMTDRLRREGSRNLVDAAAAAGAERVVAGSIAFAYRHDGPTDLPKTEEDPLIGADAPKDFRATAQAVDALERTVLGAGGLVLRYGQFYGPGTSYAVSNGPLAERVRKRGFPIVGAGGGIVSFVHVDDAAAATAAAVERGAPGVYNVVDDDPAPMRDWVPVYAEAVGAKPPRRVPVLAARIAVGPWMTLAATKSRGASNEKARRELRLGAALGQLARGVHPGRRLGGDQLGQLGRVVFLKEVLGPRQHVQRAHRSPGRGARHRRAGRSGRAVSRPPQTTCAGRSSARRARTYRSRLARVRSKPRMIRRNARPPSSRFSRSRCAVHSSRVAVPPAVAHERGPQRRRRPASHSSPMPRRANSSIIHGRLKVSTSIIVSSTVSDRMRSRPTAASSSKPTGPPMSCRTRWKESRPSASTAAAANRPSPVHE